MKIKCLGIAAAVVAASVCGSAYAGDDGNSSSDITSPAYIALLPGYFYADKGHDATRNGITMSGIVGYQFAKHWAGEVNVFGTTINTGPNSVSDFYQEGLTLDLAYNFFDRNHFTPFLIGGIGGVYDDVVPNRYDNVNFTGNAGVGFVTGPVFTGKFLNGLRLRAEVRYIYDMHKSATQSGQNDARASIGIELPLGEATPPPPPPPPPPPVQVVQAPPPPPPAPAEKQCPIPFPGAKVDKNGCVIASQTVVLHGVHFAFNKYDLRPDAKTLLDDVANALKEQPELTVEVAGHTDGIGSQAYNLKLSQKRAESVRNYLIDQGIDGGRMTAKGYGKSEPLISPEKTAADRAMNRRVEFRIETHQGVEK